MTIPELVAIIKDGGLVALVAVLAWVVARKDSEVAALHEARLGDQKDARAHDLAMLERTTDALRSVADRR